MYCTVESRSKKLGEKWYIAICTLTLSSGTKIVALLIFYDSDFFFFLYDMLKKLFGVTQVIKVIKQTEKELIE